MLKGALPVDSLFAALWAWLLPIKPITALTTASYAEMMHLLAWHGAALERALSAPIMDAMTHALERFLARMDTFDA